MNSSKIVIVTAASRGIGAGCAREMAAQGYTVSLMARSESVLHLAKELGGIAVQGSMSNLQDLELLVATTLDKFGRIDAVINSFGDPPRPDLLDIPDTMWIENFEMLFLSVVRIARLVTEPMRQQGGGAIVNISACDSQEPELGTPFSGNYTLGLGNLGFPKMGLEGIALASTLSYLGMVLCLVLYVLNHKSLKNYHLFHEWYQVKLKLLRELIWLGIPIGISFALEIGLYAVTAYLMGVLGTEALAAYQIVIQTIVILFMVPVGIGYATTIRVGQWHGQQNLQGVKQAAFVSMCLGAAFMALTAVLLLGFSKSLIALYLNLDHPSNVNVIVLATAMFAISAFSQLFDGIQTTAAGALRGLQDTRIPMLLSLLAFWVIGLSSGCVLGFVFNFGAIGLWVGQSLGVGVSAVVFVWRLRQVISKLSYQ